MLTSENLPHHQENLKNKTPKMKQYNSKNDENEDEVYFIFHSVHPLGVTTASRIMAHARPAAA